MVFLGSPTVMDEVFKPFPSSLVQPLTPKVQCECELRCFSSNGRIKAPKSPSLTHWNIEIRGLGFTESLAEFESSPSTAVSDIDAYHKSTLICHLKQIGGLNLLLTIHLLPPRTCCLGRSMVRQNSHSAQVRRNRGRSRCGATFATETSGDRPGILVRSCWLDTSTTGSEHGVYPTVRGKFQ